MKENCITQVVDLVGEFYPITETERIDLHDRLTKCLTGFVNDLETKGQKNDVANLL